MKAKRLKRIKQAKKKRKKQLPSIPRSFPESHKKPHLGSITQRSGQGKKGKKVFYRVFTDSHQAFFIAGISLLLFFFIAIAAFSLRTDLQQKKQLQKTRG